MIKGTQIRHGRGVEIGTSGYIDDAYYFNNQFHGPRRVIYTDGDYIVQECEHDVMIRNV